ncbi:hypothetical protein ETA_28510 [Erwinia tasmaniensis Et1/99]|uniref:Uncharacterized protein n=1 Tax=Erwinia tasmaniensis (strain DSM 17950 / CFBP 7177 / CIP 109463 / NCPPB 4357 / Et1/99) TaxID=465817 RepID=B2VF03_ERWT9|nr:hypothetical protein ETA_28510 [Erwinia tasmaniensis Et1/99]
MNNRYNLSSRIYLCKKNDRQPLIINKLNVIFPSHIPSRTMRYINCNQKLTLSLLGWLTEKMIPFFSMLSKMIIPVDCRAIPASVKPITQNVDNNDQHSFLCQEFFASI